MQAKKLQPTEDVTEHEEETEETAAEDGETMPVGETAHVPPRKRGRKSDPETNCYEAIAKYYGHKNKKDAPPAPLQAADEDFRFGAMIATEMKSVTHAALKRSLKKKLLECVLQAQDEQEEIEQQQQQVQVVLLTQQPALAQQQTQEPAVLQQQVVVSVAEEPQACSSKQADDAEAQLLLHLQQFQTQQ